MRAVEQRAGLTLPAVRLERGAAAAAALRPVGAFAAASGTTVVLPRLQGR